MAERRWSDADRELVADVLEATLSKTIAAVAAAVLDALTAAGWRPTAPTAQEIAVATEAAAHATYPLIAARVRAEVAGEIAQAIETDWREFGELGPLTAAAIARAHRTTPELDDA